MQIVDRTSWAIGGPNNLSIRVVKGHVIQGEKEAQELAQEHATVNSAQIEERKAAAIKKYYRGVKLLLEDLRSAVYPHSYTDKWEIYDAHLVRDNQTRVTILLQFDQRGIPACFTCCHYNYFGELIGSESSTGLSRESLIEALKKLHSRQRKKRRWQSGSNPFLFAG